MASYVKDERCIALVKVVVPLLERSGPEGAGGYGGAFQACLPSEVAVQLGGVDLIRAALRKAARELGWTSRTYGFGGGPEDATAVIGVHDTREVPPQYAQVVEQEMQRKMRAAVELVAARFSTKSGLASADPPVRGDSVQTKKFMAALAQHGMLG